MTTSGTKFLTTYLGRHAPKLISASCPPRLKLGNEGRAHTSLVPSTLKTLEKLVERAKYIAIDTETYGPYHNPTAFAWSLCDEHGNSVALRDGDLEIPCFDCQGSGKADLSPRSFRVQQLWIAEDCRTCHGRGVAMSGTLVRAIVRRIVEDESRVKIMHHRTYDEKVLRNEGTLVVGTGHDTMLMHYCLDPRRPHGLKPLAQSLGEDISDQDAVDTWIKTTRRAALYEVKRRGYYTLDSKIELNPDLITYQHVPWKIMEEYARKDAERTMLLFFYYRKSLKKKPFIDLYRLEMALRKHVARIEAYGMRWDMPMSFRLLKIIKIDTAKFKASAFAIAKKDFNLLSPKQLGNILFNELGLAVLERTDKGNPSLAKDCLVKYDHPLATQVLRYRMAVKMDRYVRNFIRSAIQGPKGWIIHPNILQHGTITGRWSVIDPPLQTTPAMDTGRRSHYIVDIRKCFIPREGTIFYLQDYSQIEIKLFVHYSGDREMRGIVERGGDVHTEMGILLTGVQPDDPEFSHVRKMIKMVNFGLIFGAGKKKMGDITHEEQGKVDEFVDRYHERFTGVREFMDKTINQALKLGYVEAYGGRRIPVDANRAYASVNYLIQGTAAWILKRGIIDVNKYAMSVGGHTILSMHDEFITEMPEDSDHVKHLRTMTKRLEIWDKEFSVPLRIDNAITATSWSDEIKVENLRAKTIHRSLAEALRLRSVRRQKPLTLRSLRIIR